MLRHNLNFEWLFQSESPERVARELRGEFAPTGIPDGLAFGIELPPLRIERFLVSFLIEEFPLGAQIPFLTQ